MLQPGCLHRTLGLRGRVPIGRVRVALPSRTISIIVTIVLQSWVKTMQGIGMLNCKRTSITLNKCVALHTIGLTNILYSN